METDTITNNKRIAKNTILLYIRMMFIMLVQLYTSRVVLNTLGVVDYGIYNVVGGMVAMFNFLNMAMTASTQRYITFELGRGNFDRLKQVFVTSVNIHVIISIVVIILTETIGLWFMAEKMVIPEDRYYAALWVFHLSVITLVVQIMSVPYNSAIIAHEKMSAFAYITVLEVTLKLAVVYLLTIWNIDKLILFAILIAIIQIMIRFCYSGYCTRHFKETNYKWSYDKALFREMLSFAGWNLWGQLSAVLFSQGINMLLNVFFGPAVNAARAVSVQVQNAIMQFSMNFQMALNPQITKSYATGQIEEMHKLMIRSSKFTFFLLFILCLPVFVETPVILELWLKNVPDYTVVFLRIIIITMIIDATANPLMISASATGRVKRYQTIIGGILLTILPISYIVLKLGAAPWSVFLVHLAVCIVAYITRLIIIRPMIQLSISRFVKEVVLRCLFVASCAIVIPVVMHIYIGRSVMSSLIIIVISILMSSLCSFYIGLDRHERIVVIDKTKVILRKFSQI